MVRLGTHFPLKILSTDFQTNGTFAFKVFESISNTGTRSITNKVRRS